MPVGLLLFHVHFLLLEVFAGIRLSPLCEGNTITHCMAFSLVVQSQTSVIRKLGFNLSSFKMCSIVLGLVFLCWWFFYPIVVI